MQKIALITGGSRGIGREICLTLAEAGYKVIINYLSNAKAAEQTLAECKGNGLIIQADVSTTEGINKLVSEVQTQFGSLDVLVNNAGITRDNLLIRMSQKEWNEVIQTNFLAIMELTEAILPIMQKQGFGKVVNISSTVGVHGNAGQTNYAAAKAALLSYTKIKARELMPQIQVNAIAPGLVQTDMTAKFDLAKLSETKLGRSAQPADIAACVKWLAEASGNYITGQIIEIDGGLFLWSDVEALV